MISVFSVLLIMPVISISLTERNLESLDALRDALSMSGRSEAVRLCLRTAEAEIREREGYQGELEGVLVMVHGGNLPDSSHRLDLTHHMFQDIITTKIHTHLMSDKCLEVMIIRGRGGKVNQMLSYFQTDDNIEYVRFLRS